MHHEINKALYNAFDLNEKSEFFAGYLYMKYPEHFIAAVIRNMGMTCREPAEKLDESLTEMLEFLAHQVAEAGASTDTSVYHGKIVKLHDAVQILTQKENLHLVPSEKVLPFKIARDVILENPDSIAVGPCPCRAVSENPCLPPPMEVCLWPGDPNASFIAGQNPKFRKISQDEAVKILEDCHKKGFVHTAYFEKAAANRLDVICNCCDCCCMGIKMFNLFDMDDQNVFLAPSGYATEIGPECDGCGLCAENTCHFHAISMDEEGQRAVIRFEKCMGCGICEDVCPSGAIRLHRDPSKGDPLDLEEMKR